MSSFRAEEKEVYVLLRVFMLTQRRDKLRTLACIHNSCNQNNEQVYVLLRVFMRMSRSSMARSVMTRCSRRTLDSDTRQSGKLPTNTPSLDNARICRAPT